MRTGVRARHLCPTSPIPSLFPPRVSSGKKQTEHYARNSRFSRTSLPREVRNSASRGVDLVGGGTFWGDYGVFAEAAEQRLSPAKGGQVPVLASPR